MPKCQRSKWAENTNFLLLCQSQEPPKPIVAFPLPGFQAVLVKVLQEELQSLKKAKENVYITGAGDLFQATLSTQTIYFTTRC